jgi:hypothetical protein
VTQVARSGILPKEDEDTIALIEAALREDGVRLLTHTRTLRCEVVDGEQRLVVTSGPGVHPVGAHPDQSSGGAEEALPFDLLLCAIGRRARVTGFGLEALGIPLTAAGTIETNAYLQTRYPNILACGDVVGPHQFTHVAAHQAWYAAVNGLFSGIKRFKTDDRVIPRVTFTDPEVAQVGLTERQAQARGIAYEVTRYGLDDLDRAITESAAHGFVKVLTPPGKDRILGACIVGEHAGELLAELTLAMKHGLGLERILGTIHPYPTWSEAAKYAAGNWKRAHAPQTALAWLARFHDLEDQPRHPADRHRSSMTDRWRTDPESVQQGGEHFARCRYCRPSMRGAEGCDGGCLCPPRCHFGSNLRLWAAPRKPSMPWNQVPAEVHAVLDRVAIGLKA